MFRDAIQFPEIPAPALSTRNRARRAEHQPLDRSPELRFDEIDEDEDEDSE